MAHYLYLVRHGEQLDAEHSDDGPLTPRGREQAAAVAKRLRAVPFTRALHSPMERARETAEVMGSVISGLEAQPSDLLADCVPSGPSPDMPAVFEQFFGAVSAREIERGEAQMAAAVPELLRPTPDDQQDLLVTHNFVIGWFVREVFRAPPWAWLGLNQANCGLTIIRFRSALSLVTFHDVGHLPPHLRSGLPEDQPV